MKESPCIKRIYSFKNIEWRLFVFGFGAFFILFIFSADFVSGNIGKEHPIGDGSGWSGANESLANMDKPATQNTGSAYSSRAYEILYSDPDSARIISREGLQDSGDTLDDTETIFLTSIIGMSYLLQSDYSQALKMFYETLQLATSFGLESEKAHAYGNIGVTYLAIDNSKVALDYLLRAQNAYVLLDDTVNYASAHNNIATVYLKISDLEKAAYHLSTAEKGFADHNHLIGLSSVTNQRGQYYLLSNKPDSAAYYINKAIEMGIETNNSFNLIHFYQHKASLYYKLKKYEKSVFYYLKQIPHPPASDICRDYLLRA